MKVFYVIRFEIATYSAKIVHKLNGTAQYVYEFQNNFKKCKQGGTHLGLVAIESVPIFYSAVLPKMLVDCSLSHFWKENQRKTN